MNTETQDFVYVTYIKTTPERLWDALTTPAFTRQYWFDIDVTSDWKVGSPISYVRDGKTLMAGKVLKADKPKVMSYTFHEEHTEASHEPPTRVTLELEQQPNTEVVKLTVIHTDFVTNSKHKPSISKGWPMVLSGLKTFLETNASMHVVGCGQKS